MVDDGSYKSQAIERAEEKGNSSSTCWIEIASCVSTLSDWYSCCLCPAHSEQVSSFDI